MNSLVIKPASSGKDKSNEQKVTEMKKVTYDVYFTFLSYQTLCYQSS